ncbi:hypothetical protein [Permianibacter aggregans]|uniref:Uncharacterized protein n=1 Tax=Permianibacter aggregans TaxID=1510150 RepID=A0A4R6UW36_9GAMM|nr:hypothetical protein [Permianibacter aggregans]QGX38694.1 hypothetical protein E2H98_03070 [Permianibacter aggregans]TDQ50486.1 hypothetical protein EV696_102168 [Permianibacter aggregans]
MKTSLLVVTAASALFLSACSSVEKKFSGEQIPNISHFSEQTNALLGEFSATALSTEADQIGDLLNAKGAAERQYRDNVRVINGLLAGVRDYSAKLVNIAEMRGSESEKIAAYHALLHEYVPGLTTALKLPEDHFQATLQDVLRQENLRKAIRQAEPIVEAAVTQLHNELNLVEQSADAVVASARQRLQNHFQPLLDSQAPLYAEKTDLLKQYVKVLEQRSAQTQALPGGTRQRIQDLLTVQALLEKDWQHYQQQREALARLTNTVREESARLRYFMHVWARAHQKMATGVYLPAEWFDLNDLPGQLLKRARL